MEKAGDEPGRWRDSAAVSIPNRLPQSLHKAVNDVFFTGASRGVSYPGPSPCPACDGNCTSTSLRSILPWSADNVLDRLYIACFQGDADDDAGKPSAPSTALSLGIKCSLVAAVYSILNHVVTELFCKGRWFKYDMTACKEASQLLVRVVLIAAGIMVTSLCLCGIACSPAEDYSVPQPWPPKAFGSRTLGDK